MIAFVRNEDILGELYIPSKNNSNGIGIVWLPGLPNNPVANDMAKPLSDLGFTVLQARYPGSWQSYGRFGPKSSLQGAILGLELLSRGRALNLNTLEEVRWKVNRCILVGNSYGGGIAVSALGTSNLADAAIAFCPLVEPSRQNSNNDEDDLTTLYPYLERCHENVFRHLDKKEWQHYLDGTHPTDPNKFIDKIINKPLLLVHGALDKSILPYHTENFYRELINSGSSKAEILIEPDVGHGKELRISTKDSWVKWLINKRNGLWKQ